jgi:hypothetical protein
MPGKSQNGENERLSRPNRAKKVAGRRKQRRYVQGTRSYLHAMTNSAVKRLAAKRRKRR